MLTVFDYFEKSRSSAIHIDFLILGKRFLSLDNQERIKEAKSLAVKKTEGNNMRKQERENVSYHQQD